MKPKDPKETEIRTPNENILICTVIDGKDGSREIISRRGKLEDRMKVDEFLKKVYS
ncbi:MAG: hypothetical protein IKN47_00275 [Lachnospiraceae bacterium]|nr:hypothetical protein [Lachnospiraceae bacterium]